MRLEAGAFVHALFRKGAFQGTSRSDAFFVRCGAETMTAVDIADGRCILEWGLAPMRAGEFAIGRMTFLTAGSP